MKLLDRVTGIPRRTLTRLESGDPAVRIGTYAKAASALGLVLTLRGQGLKRPTLDELDELYRESDAGDSIDKVQPPSRRRMPPNDG